MAEASAKFRAQHVDAVKLLDEIKTALAGEALKQAYNFGPLQTNWSDVAEMQRTVQALTEVADRLLKRGEYAPINVDGA